MSEGFVESSFELLETIEPHDFWFVARNRLLAWALGKWAPSATSMLEVGCGTGYVLSGMRAARGLNRVVGTELFEAGLDVARRRLGEDVELRQLDATGEMPWRDEFDIVGCFDVLEHIEDDQAALRGLSQAVHPAGLVAVTVPQHRWLWSRADDYGHHVRRYRRSELHERMRTAGLEPVMTTSFVAMLLPLMFLSRWLERGKKESFDPALEHERARKLFRPLSAVMTFERALIRLGLRFPCGGSLMVLARRR